MEKIFFKLIAISLILAGSFSCNEKEDIQIEGIQKEVQENVPTEDIQKEDDQTEDDQTEETCNIDNPLIDLPWLAARINEINLLSQKKKDCPFIYANARMKMEKPVSGKTMVIWPTFIIARGKYYVQQMDLQKQLVR